MLNGHGTGYFFWLGDPVSLWLGDPIPCLGLLTDSKLRKENQDEGEKSVLSIQFMEKKTNLRALVSAGVGHWTQAISNWTVPERRDGLSKYKKVWEWWVSITNAVLGTRAAAPVCGRGWSARGWHTWTAPGGVALRSLADVAEEAIHVSLSANKSIWWISARSAYN